jgi:hypothetical protein
MSRKKFILVAAVVCIIIAGLAFLWVFRPSVKNVRSKKADTEITSQELVQKFETNEAEANKAYNDKVILVSGLVESVTEDANAITVTLKNPEDISGVLCSFDKGSARKESFIVGEQVKIKGLCTGFLMDVVLNKCSLED